jgi:formyl-CoA transferase
MQDAMLHYIRFAFQTQAVTGEAAGRTGSGSGSRVAPSGLFPCAPGGANDWVYVFARQRDHWDRLLTVIGRADLVGDERYGTPLARADRQSEVDAMVAAFTRRHDKHAAMRLIGAAGVPAGAVLDTMELINEPSFEGRGILQVMRHPSGPFKMPSWPVRFDGMPPRLEPAPLLGEHAEVVFGEWLGMSRGDVEALRQEGVI